MGVYLFLLIFIIIYSLFTEKDLCNTSTAPVQKCLTCLLVQQYNHCPEKISDLSIKLLSALPTELPGNLPFKQWLHLETSSYVVKAKLRPWKLTSWFI